ncbi:hypothetical protein JHK85_000825 [Glycine max]|uniref:Uncharacterized protein n=1 Tax=Glycine max TaxID=3847 RepID=A0A0R0L802_SOYBN|nr:hypothetical protein JHK87_000805 [Glycine soja]KAG5068448.1 hypothetical protein JHK85_000825 [Glycine max]
MQETPLSCSYFLLSNWKVEISFSRIHVMRNHQTIWMRKVCIFQSLNLDQIPVLFCPYLQHHKRHCH